MIYFPKKIVVGLTGGIASGKSTLLELFRQNEWVVLSSDEIVADLLSVDIGIKEALVDRWGSNVIFSTGIIDKSKIAQIIFSNPLERIWLENVLHPKVRDKWVSSILNSTKARFVVEIPLLFEKKIDHYFKYIICTFAPIDLRIKRLLMRGLNEKEAKSRISIQMPSDKKNKLADYVFLASGSKEFLIPQYEQFMKSSGLQ